MEWIVDILKGLAKQWRDTQFENRFQEIRENIVSDPEVFRKAIQENIKSELVVGRR